MILMQCPSCRATLTAAHGLAGRSAHCPKCWAEVAVVPGDEPPATDPDINLHLPTDAGFSLDAPARPEVE